MKRERLFNDILELMREERSTELWYVIDISNKKDLANLIIEIERTTGLAIYKNEDIVFKYLKNLKKENLIRRIIKIKKIINNGKLVKDRLGNIKLDKNYYLDGIDRLDEIINKNNNR